MEISGSFWEWVVALTFAVAAALSFRAGVMTRMRHEIRKAKEAHHNANSTIRILAQDIRSERERADAYLSAIVIHKNQVEAIVSGDGVPHFDDGESDEFTQADQELYARFDAINNGNYNWRAPEFGDPTLQEPPEFVQADPGLHVIPSTSGEQDV